MENKQLAEINNEAGQLVKQAEGYQVVTQVNYDLAGNFLKMCMTLEKKVKLFFEPTIEAFKRAKAEAENGRKAEVERMEKCLAPVNQAISIIRQKCKTFEDEQIRKQQEEQARLEVEAKIKAEEERKKLEEQAETEKAWGDAEKAEELKKEAEKVEVKVEEAKPTFARTTGMGIRRTWNWRIIDESLIPHKYFVLDTVMINKEVRANEKDTNIPGIEVYYE